MIYLDSAVLIALALVVPPAEAIAVFTVGQLLSVLALRQGVRYLFVNVGMAVLGSTAALLLLDRLRGAPGTPREVGTVLVMSAAYMAVTLLITSLSFTCERGGSVLGGLRQTCRLSVTLGPLVLDSIGYLAVVVGRSSIWALLLMAGPIALLTLTTRVLDRAQSTGSASASSSRPQTSPMPPTTWMTWSRCSCGRRARVAPGARGAAGPGAFGGRVRSSPHDRRRREVAGRDAA